MHVNICEGLGVIAGENGFVVIIHGKLYGTFPYSMKSRILSLFDPS